MLRLSRIDLGDPTLGDRGTDDVALCKAGCDILPFIGVSRDADRLQTALVAVQGLAKNLHPIGGISACGYIKGHDFASAKTAARERVAMPLIDKSIAAVAAFISICLREG
jgi:hypothetical protein